MQAEQLLREYSGNAGQLHLPRAYPGECSMPGMELLRVGENALNIEGTALRTKLEQRVQKKGQKPTRRYVDTMLVHRVLPAVSRGDEHTPMMLGVLQHVADCSHSHLVLELNVLAFLLKLPPSVQLVAYVHLSPQPLDQEARKPELVIVERVPDLIRNLLNDAFLRRRTSTVSGAQTDAAVDEGIKRTGLCTRDRAVASSTSTNYISTDTSIASATDSHTGGGSPVDSPPPSGAPTVQQVRRHLQQQVLF